MEDNSEAHEVKIDFISPLKETFLHSLCGVESVGSNGADDKLVISLGMYR